MVELQKEREIFNRNLSEWRKNHLGQFVLIKEDQIISFFDSLEKAFTRGSELYGLDSFFIDQVLPDSLVNVSLFGQDSA